MNLRDYSDKLHNWWDKLHQTTTNVPNNAFHLSLNAYSQAIPKGMVLFSFIPLSYHCHTSFGTNSKQIRNKYITNSDTNT